MPIERIDIKKKWPIPAGVKMVLMLLVIIGFLMHNCWQKNKAANVLITNIKLENTTRVSAEVTFVAANRATTELTKTLKISLQTKSGELIADKLTNITIPAKSHKTYRKVLQKFQIPLDNPENVKTPIIEIYK